MTNLEEGEEEDVDLDMGALVPPPPRYPDLHAVAFAAYSCAHFGLAYLAAVGAMLHGASHAASARHAHTPMDGPTSSAGSILVAFEAVDGDALAAASGPTATAKVPLKYSRPKRA